MHLVVYFVNIIMHDVQCSACNNRICYDCGISKTSVGGETDEHLRELFSEVRQQQLFHSRVKECNLCGRKFMSSSSLWRHKRENHSTKKIPQCKVCGKKFAYESNLRTHELSHTDVKPFKCNVCEKRFRYKQHYQSHVCISNQ